MNIVYKELGSEYARGYTDAIENMNMWQQKRRQQEQARKERHRYFIKQRLTGLFLIVLTALEVKLLDGDATIALITVPLGLNLIFTREMRIMNRFYWWTKERNSNG